jgi:hypothetical protein
LAAVSSSAFVGEAPVTLAPVNFTPRGCKMYRRRLMKL